MSGVTLSLTVNRLPAEPAAMEAFQRLTVETSTELAGAFSLRFGISPTRAGDWSLLDTDQFRPLTPVGVRIGTGIGLPAAVINGYVTATRCVWEEGGGASLTVQGTDATGLMNLEEKSKAWPNLPDSAIATAIFATYQLVPRVDPTSPTLVEPEGTTVQRATDIRFLRRLARRNGFHCYVQPEPVTGVDQGFFGSPAVAGMPVAVLSVAMGADTNVGSLRARNDMTRPTAAVAAGLDTATKAPGVGLAPVSTLPPMGVEPTLARLLAGGGTATVRPVDSGALTASELQTLAQSIANRSSMSVTIEGKTGSDVGVLRPGSLVALRGAGRVFNGLYLLGSVRLELSEGKVEQRFTAHRNAVAMTGAEPYVEVS